MAEKKTEGEVAITSKRGNKIKKNAEPDNPANHIERSGNDVVKKASELNVEKKANGSGGSESKTGDKRKHDDGQAGEKDNDKGAALEENADGKTIKAAPGGNKKQKKEEPTEAPKSEKKQPGRPKSNGAPSKPKKDPKPRSTDGIGSRTRSRQK